MASMAPTGMRNGGPEPGLGAKPSRKQSKRPQFRANTNVKRPGPGMMHMGMGEGFGMRPPLPFAFPHRGHPMSGMSAPMAGMHHQMRAHQQPQPPPSRPVGQQPIRVHVHLSQGLQQAPHLLRPPGQMQWTNPQQQMQHLPPAPHLVPMSHALAPPQPRGLPALLPPAMLSAPPQAAQAIAPPLGMQAMSQPVGTLSAPVGSLSTGGMLLSNGARKSVGLSMLQEKARPAFNQHVEQLRAPGVQPGVVPPRPFAPRPVAATRPTDRKDSMAAMLSASSKAGFDVLKPQVAPQASTWVRKDLLTASEPRDGVLTQFNSCLHMPSTARCRAFSTVVCCA